MVSQYGTSAALAGLALTVAAQGRLPSISHVLAARLGALGLSIGVASLFVVAATGATPIVVVVGWAFAGRGSD